MQPCLPPSQDRRADVSAVKLAPLLALPAACPVTSSTSFVSSPQFACHSSSLQSAACPLAPICPSLILLPGSVQCLSPCPTLPAACSASCLLLIPLPRSVRAGCCPRRPALT